MSSVDWCYLLFLIIVIDINADEHEYQLYKVLMTNYTNLERPVSNNSLPVTVIVDLILQQIVDVDEKNQVIEINAWIK
jgi:hypothetical protein